MKNWKNITTEEEIELIIIASEHKPQIIFKDSTTCGISAFAKERLTNGSDLLTETADFNYLDLLNYRSVSNFIAKELNVIHQSPQIIVIKNGKVVFKDSHHSIEPEKITKYL
ncbi:bacillithiol system redox-active protein YtxJ [Flavobacterium sp.]|uniref:bacillithiol system redox-active protein YtxJ n=1 Tax=Flavobacterium sp. TaxID=239 RepID=UPI003750574C